MKIGKILNRKNIRKLPNFLLAKFLRRERAWGQPFRIQIEPTTRCNLECVMCTRKTEIKESNNMSFDEFKTIIDKFPNTLLLNLQGLGEPFLNDDIFDMIEYAKGKGIYVFTISNGTLLTHDANEKIVKSGLDHISVSIDGPTKEIYEDIRRGADFDEVLKNIKNLDRVRKNLNSDLEIKINGLLNKQNFDMLKKYVEIANEMEVDQVTLKKLLFSDVDKSAETVALTDEQSKNINRKIDEICKLAKEKGIKLVLSGNEDCYLNCSWSWEDIYINYNGDVTPCCSLPSYKMGNILEESFKEIWNNKKYRKFRGNLKKCKPKICKKKTEGV